jgi:hypothetical protein
VFDGLLKQFNNPVNALQENPAFAILHRLPAFGSRFPVIQTANPDKRFDFSI